MSVLVTEDRDRFLREPRVAVLTTLSGAGTPISVPIWFEWDGEQARMFTPEGSPKLARIRRNPQASLLVANPTGEPEAWVSIEGPIEISSEGGFELAERMAHRYWPLTGAQREVLEEWRTNAPNLLTLAITPRRIRSYFTERPDATSGA